MPAENCIADGAIPRPATKRGASPTPQAESHVGSQQRAVGAPAKAPEGSTTAPARSEPGQAKIAARPDRGLPLSVAAVAPALAGTMVANQPGETLPRAAFRRLLLAVRGCIGLKLLTRPRATCVGSMPPSPSLGAERHRRRTRWSGRRGSTAKSCQD